MSEVAAASIFTAKETIMIVAEDIPHNRENVQLVILFATSN